MNKKLKTLLIITIILFLLVNTTYYWEGLIGPWIAPSLLVLLVIFVALSIGLLLQFLYLAKERLRNKPRFYLVIAMTILLGVVLLKPHGIIDFEKFESKDILVAGRKGSANCTTTLRLKQDSSFYIQDVCFGVSKTAGTYKIKHDTLFFYYQLALNRDRMFKFGIIKQYQEELVLYKTKKDTLPFYLTVFKDELKKK